MADHKMGNKGEKVEKSNFSQTCRLLSQYFKEKGSWAGLGIDMAPKPLDQQAGGKSRAPTTMSLLPGVVDVSGEDQTERNQEKNSPRSMDLFPQHSGFGSGALPEEEPGKTSDKREREKGQLTIFYGGKVLVFDNFPADKAKDLMQMASKQSIASRNFSFSSPHTSTVISDCPSKPESMAAVASAPPNSTSKPNDSDMPIARKNSLHRFLEKRKDRINTKAPYQVNGSSSASTNEAKPESSQSWLNLGRQVSQPAGHHISESSK